MDTRGGWRIPAGEVRRSEDRRRHPRARSLAGFVLKYRDEIFPGRPRRLRRDRAAGGEARRARPRCRRRPDEGGPGDRLWAGPPAPSGDPARRRGRGQVEDGFVLGRGGQEGIPRLRGKVEFATWPACPWTISCGKAARLSRAKSIVYYLNMFEDGRGRTFVPAEVVDRLSAAANAPSTAISAPTSGGGSSAAAWSASRTEGEKAALGWRRGLSRGRGAGGASPSPEPTRDPYVFDWRQLRRWGDPRGAPAEREHRPLPGAELLGPLQVADPRRRRPRASSRRC